METLTFAVAASSPGADGHLATLCSELERVLPCRVSPQVLSSYAEMKSEIEAGRVEMAWAPPRVAVDLEDAGHVSIELCCTRGGQIVYHAALFTQHASRIEKLGDLEGCHVGWVDVHSAAGYLVPRQMLAEARHDPEKLFGKETFFGTHGGVARAVLEGEADVGATYVSLDPGTQRAVSAGWLDAGAGINGAFIVATTGAIPSDAIVVSKRVDADRRAAIVEQMMKLPAALPEVVGRLLGADGFVRPPAAHFDSLRKKSSG